MIVVTIEEISSGSDDYGHMKAYVFPDVTQAVKKLTAWGFKDEKCPFRDHDTWVRCGGFHNEQRATLLPAIEES